MADIHSLANAIIRMEGSDQPNSVNQRMVREFNRWNVGHLVWAGQRGAVPVYIAGRNWAGWPTREEAYEGLLRQIRLDASRGQTLEQFISKYAPPTENATHTYIANMEAWVGVPRTTLLSSIVSGTPTPGPTPTPGSPASPGPTSPQGGPVYAAWAGTWTDELAQTLNTSLGASLTGSQALLALAGATVLILVVATPSRSPAY